MRIRSLFMFLMLPLAGCGTGMEEFPVAPVKGTVMCDGAPVPYVFVYFEPIMDGKSAIVGKPGFGIADVEGNFTLTTYHDADGAVVGKHRVRVEAPRGERADGFECACQLSDSIDVMEVVIKEDQENVIEVVLKPKTAKEKPMTDYEKEELEGI
jgi:hypothetical protein